MFSLRRGSKTTEHISHAGHTADVLLAAQSLKSGNPVKQLKAIQQISDSVVMSLAFPSNEILVSIIDYGLSSENNQVRVKSFRLIQYLYVKKRTFLWAEIRDAIVAELSTAECCNCLAAAIALLGSVDDKELITFFLSKDGMSIIKSCCSLPDPELRRISFIGLGNLLLRTWQSVSYNDIEVIISVESVADSRRVKEDFIDFSLEIISLFANGAIGKINPTPPTESSQPMEDCFSGFEGSCVALSYFFNAYNSNFDQLDLWSSSLIGLSRYISTNDSAVRRCNAANLVPVIKQALATLLADPCAILTRWETWNAATASTRLVSGMVLALLNDLPPGFSSSQPLFDVMLGATSIFSLSSDGDETLSSRQGGRPLPVLHFAEEWLLSYLSVELAGTNSSSVCAAVHEAVSMCLFPGLTSARLQIAPTIFNTIIRLLRTHENDSDASFPIRSKLIAWGLLCARWLPLPLLSKAIVPLCEYIARLSDDSILTRLTTETAMMILIEPAAGGHASPPQLLQIVLEDSWIKNLLCERWGGGSAGGGVVGGGASMALGGAAVGGAAAGVGIRQQFRHRFVTALCRGAQRTLPLAVALVRKLSGVCDGAIIAADEDFLVGLGAWSRRSCDTVGGLAAVADCKHREYFSDSLHDSRKSLLNILTSVVTIIKTCHSCLLWSTAGLQGDSAALSLLALADATCGLLLNPNPILDFEHLNLSGVDEIDSTVLNIADITRQLCCTLDSMFASYLANEGSALTTASSAKHTQISLRAAGRRGLAELLLTRGKWVSKFLGESFNARADLMLAIIRERIFHTRRQQQLVAHLLEQARVGSLGGTVADLQPGAAGLAEQEERVEGLAWLQQLAWQAQSTDICDKCLGLLYEFQDAITSDIGPHSLTKGRVPAIAVSTVGQSRELLEKVATTEQCLRTARTAAASLGCTESRREQSENHRRVSGRLSTSGSALSSSSTSRKKYSLNYETLLTSGKVNARSMVLRGTTGQLQSQEKAAHSPIATNESLPPATAQSLAEIMGAAVTVPVNRSCEAREVGRQFGAFSYLAAQMARHTPPGSGLTGSVSSGSAGTALIDKQIASVDIMAQMDDVFEGHMVGPAHRSTEETVAVTETELLAKMLCPLGELQWTQVSGSGDPLVVLAAIECLPRSQSAVVHIRTINGSGFKIPVFAVDVRVRAQISTGLSSSSIRTCSEEATFEDENDDDGNNLSDVAYRMHISPVKTGTVNSCFSASRVPDAAAPVQGPEYFLPGAMAEEKFTVLLKRFSALDVMVRVVYPELQSEDASGLFALSKAVQEDRPTGGEEDSNIARPSGHGEKKKEKKKSSKAGATKLFTAEVDCVPLRMGVVHQLLPYGCGSVTSMGAWLRGKPGPLIPLAVFQAQWERLPAFGRGYVTWGGGGGVQEATSGGSLFRRICAACMDELSCTPANSSGATNGIITGISSLINTNTLHCLIGMAAQSLPLALSSVAWSFQTLWGAEVAIRVTELSSEDYYGEIEFKSTDEGTLRAVLSDANDLIVMITGGLLTGFREAQRVRTLDTLSVDVDGNGWRGTLNTRASTKEVDLKASVNDNLLANPMQLLYSVCGVEV